MLGVQAGLFDYQFLDIINHSADVSIDGLFDLMFKKSGSLSEYK